jgi:hypothetical protein
MAAPSRRPRACLSACQRALALELPAPPQLMPLPESRRWLGVSPEACARLFCTGQLPVVPLGRQVRLDERVLLSWLAAPGRLPVPGEA